jgi:hypothetical protein
MEALTLDPDLTGEETTAAPVDQAPLDWTENIDWTIKKTKSVRSKFSKILQSEDYITRSKWMDARFQKELDAVKSLRARKQMAYAKKALGRRPMSKQANFNRQHGTMAIISILRYDEHEPRIENIRNLMNKCSCIPLIEQESKDAPTPLLHWQTPMSNMERIIKANLFNGDLRVRTCSFDILGIQAKNYNNNKNADPMDIKPPKRGNGNGTVADPMDIDQETGRIHPGVVLLRTVGGCDIRSVVCELCRQKALEPDIALLKSHRKPRLWSARDKRGDRAIEKKVRVQEILDANTAVPCPRGAASSPLLSPITKRTRSIYWNGVFSHNQKNHEEKQQQKNKNKKQQQRQQQQKRQPKSQKKNNKKKKTAPLKKIPKVNIEKRRMRTSKSDHILHILGHLDTLTHFDRSAPMSTKIVGTRLLLETNQAQHILRQRINLATGAVLLQQKRQRRLRKLKEDKRYRD